MGGLSDILGGKKAPPPPAEIRKSAEAAYRLAQGYEGRPGEFRGAADRYLGGDLNADVAAIRARYLDAARRSGALAGDYDDLWGDGNMILREAAGDALVAGSDGRQMDAARSAREQAISGIDAAMAGRRDDLMRRGRVAGGGDSPHLAVLEGAVLGGAANRARLDERRYGEMFRRGFVPTAMNFGDRSLAYLDSAAMMRRGANDANLMIPRVTAELFDAERALTGGAQGLYGTGQAMFGHSYNADMTKLNADNARRARIFNNVGKILTMDFGGGGEEDDKKTIAKMLMGAG